MAKVFVTGATGFIGSHFVSMLLERKHNVHIIARQSSHTDFLPDGISVHRCSLLDPSPLRKHLIDADYFVHIAGLTKSRRKKDFYDINGESVRVWMNAVKENSHRLKRFVLVSSQAAVRPSKQPISENAEPAPITDYGRSKLLGEKYALEFMDYLPITIIRPPVVYGPRDKDVFFYFKLASIGFLPFVGNPKRKFSAIYVKDLAEAIMLVMEHCAAEGEIFFVSDGDVHTWRSFALKVGDAVGGRKIKIRLPGAVLWLAAAIDETASFIVRKPALLSFQKVRELLRYWAMDSSKIMDKLGFEPKYDLSRGVKETAHWYREHGWIR